MIWDIAGLADGQTHVVQVVVESSGDRGAASLFADGALIDSARPLEGAVDDCGVASDECITHVGQREGSSSVDGCVRSASIQF